MINVLPLFPQPLRILMIAHGDKLGGMERHVVMLSETLAANGHQVAYAGPMNNWLGEQMHARGFTCCDVTFNGMYDFFSFWKLKKFAKQFDANVLHGHSQRGGRYAAWVGRLLKLPAIATAHSTAPSKWFARNENLNVIAVSHAVKKALHDSHVPDKRVQTIHLGIPDLPFVTPPSPDEITAERPLVFGMIARVLHVKGQDLAIRALAQIKEYLPARLLIVGDDTTDWGIEHKSVAQELGVADQVEFLGQREDIAELLSQFDVMLSPSRREALSLSLIEASAASRASIASDVGGIPEVVQDGKTGILVPGENIQALAEAMLKMRDASLRVAYGHAARQYYEQEFTIEAMRKNTLQYYHHAIHEMSVG